MRKLSYPNLELLEYKFLQQLSADKDFKSKLDGKRQRNRYANIDIIAEVFPQMWGSTATAFDTDKEGNPLMGGCAMTEAYTVVFHERTTDYYGVFVDNRPCYMVHDPSDQFLKDLSEQSMASYSIAKKKY